MIVVHHLNESRSLRILWLMEELGLPYEVAYYQRDPKTRLAPPELMDVHPLGKSPVVTDDGRTIVESAAIIDYVIRRHGGGRLQPDPAGEAYDTYQQWLHYGESSFILPLILALYVGRLGEAGAPLHPRVDSETTLNLAYVDKALAGRDYLMGDDLTGADILLSFPAEFAGRQGRLGPYENIRSWLDRLHARPAYRAAVARGEPKAA